MEMRGDTPGGQQKTFRVPRRSCDQCRTRKVGCDRGSPCSPCASARLSCTHSAVASNSTGPKQRVLISAQYEQKIDGIAKDIEGIKQLLRTLQVSGAEIQSKPSAALRTTQVNLNSHPENVREFSSTGDEIAWVHSTHMVDLIRAVVRDGAVRANDFETNQVLSSLKKLLQILESPPASVRIGSPQDAEIALNTNITMPPQGSVVTVLRWAKENASNVRLAWLAQILPLSRFTEICQNIYFSVNGYSEIDYILANGYLSYVFFEHLVVSGRLDFAEHSRLCRNNLNTALAKLPLLISSSTEVVAALTLGAYNAVEDSKVNVAWTFISAASNHCLTLGFNRLQSYPDKSKRLDTAQEQLFWAVYRLDKGISLRLGRSSNLHDGDISLLPIPDDARIRTASIQGRAYDELYSPKGLMHKDFERACIAESLAAELQQCINETRADILAFDSDSANPTDSVGKAYMQCELICQYSLLTLILRAVPAPVGSICSISDECLTMAREALHAHEECISIVSSCKNGPLMLARYVNWAIVHCPFPPFSILLTHAIQLMDASELSDLERFAASLEPPGFSVESDSITQPKQLYNILCKAARLYLDFNTAPTTSDLLGSQRDAFSGTSPIGTDINAFTFAEPEHEEEWLGEWFYENQLVMSVLDENTFF